jgi:hypothetical protein
MTLEELEAKVMAVPGARERIEARCDELLVEQGYVQLGICKYCSKPLWQKRRGRDRLFCDTECRDRMYREEAGNE